MGITEGGGEMIEYGYSGISLGSLDYTMMGSVREWRNNWAIRRVCRQVGLISEEMQKKWFDGLVNDKSTQMFSVRVFLQQESQTTVGVCGLTSIHPTHRSAEISLYVAPEYQKRIRGAGVIKTLVRYAFEEMNLNRVWGDTFSYNDKEILNLQELGFKHEGTLRQSYWKEGEYIDSVVQGMLRTDYEKAVKQW